MAIMKVHHSKWEQGRNLVSNRTSFVIPGSLLWQAGGHEFPQLHFTASVPTEKNHLTQASILISTLKLQDLNYIVIPAPQQGFISNKSCIEDPFHFLTDIKYDHMKGIGSKSATWIPLRLSAQQMQIIWTTDRDRWEQKQANTWANDFLMIQTFSVMSAECRKVPINI